MDHAVNVVVDQEPGNSEQSIAHLCQGCGKGVVRYPIRKPKDCGLVQLKVSNKTRTRQRLEELIRQSRLPKEEFARHVLGVHPTTLWRYMTGGPIPNERAQQLHDIEDITRDGTYLYTVTRCPDRPRWNSMLLRRSRKEIAYAD